MMMEWTEKLLLYLSYPFVRYALIAGVLIALCYRGWTFACGLWRHGSGSSSPGHEPPVVHSGGDYDLCSVIAPEGTVG